MCTKGCIFVFGINFNISSAFNIPAYTENIKNRNSSHFSLYDCFCNFTKFLYPRLLTLFIVFCTVHTNVNRFYKKYIFFK